MADKHLVVVDGSNLATEGRTLPSLRQLDEAVRAYAAEDPDAEIVVVVDATFEHRIDASERAQLREAEEHGEVVSPPAGAIGRGDAFVLRIAERTGATVLSNDSFQEFHGEHPWLFEPGRLVGGKPVPGVGWIFTPRVPVRGAKSRRVARALPEGSTDGLPAPLKAAELAKAARKVARGSGAAPEGTGPRIGDVRLPAPVAATPQAGATPEAPPEPVPTATPPDAGAPRAAPPEPAPLAEPSIEAEVPGKPPAVRAAIEEAIAEALSPPQPPERPPGEGRGKRGKNGKKKRARGARGQRATTPPPAVNDPLAFITFVATFPVGSTVVGDVVSFTSHGAMVEVGLPDGGALHCYVPLSGLGDPPPTKARQVLARGERREFVLIGLDPQRRVAELALPGVPATAQAGS